MDIILLIRRNEDYWLRGKFDFSDAIGHHIIHSKGLKLLITAWNFHFKMKYMDFRIRLREIAYKTFARNNFDDILMYFDMERYDSISPGSLIVPIDEDDWLSSNFITEIKKVEVPYERIYWDVCHKKCGRYPLFVGKRHIESCAYGVKNPVDFYIYKNHLLFNKEGAYHIPKALALKHNNISSLSLFYEVYFKKDNFKNLVLDSIKELEEYVYHEEYKKEGSLYEELLKELLASAYVPL